MAYKRDLATPLAASINPGDPPKKKATKGLKKIGAIGSVLPKKMLKSASGLGKALAVVGKKSKKRKPVSTLKRIATSVPNKKNNKL